MKANSTKRKIFDAVDLLTEDTSSQMPVKTMKGGVTMLDIDSIKPFHNHPFHLYEGDTGHYWYLHCTGYPTEGTCIIFHKHRFNHPYHQHGRARTLHQAVKNIKGHDEWQMNGKHR